MGGELVSDAARVAAASTGVLSARGGHVAADGEEVAEEAGASPVGDVTEGRGVEEHVAHLHVERFLSCGLADGLEKGPVAGGLVVPDVLTGLDGAERVLGALAFGAFDAQGLD